MTRWRDAGEPGASPGVRSSLALASLAVLLASFLVGAFQFFAMRDEMVHDLRVQARIVADNASAALRFDDADSAGEIVQTWAGSPAVSAATFFDTRGRVLATYARDDVALARLPAGLAVGTHDVGLTSVTLVEAVHQRDAVVGYLALRARLDALYRRLALFALAEMLAGLGALGLAFLLSTRLRRAVQHAEQRLARMARVDLVTGLANRHSYAEIVQSTARRAASTQGQFALLLVDLDNFKAINDTMGHATGDELLRLAGQRLVNAVRANDTVCRIGGDEFAIIAGDVGNAADAAQIAETLVRSLAAPFRVNGRDLWATGSVGVTLYPQDAQDLDALLGQADVAMYAAKSGGRNGYRAFRPEMNELAVERIDLANDLRRALDDDALAIHYQPQIVLASGRVVSAEALARWPHPVRGMISPHEFIPVAEQSGLIVPLGRAMLRRACAEAAAWNRRRDAPVAVAVNLSAHDLADPGLPATVAGALADAGLPPTLLEIEITESVLIDSLKATEQTLARVRALGVRVAIDDFGTGYCSMGYLKRLPVNRVKIDRTFVRDLASDASDAKLTGAMIAMAHALGLDVVAEGVENDAQLAVLREQGCDLVQGYYTGRPMTREALIAWLADREAAAAAAAAALAAG